MADEFVGTLEKALTLWRTLTFQHGRQAEMVEGVEKYRQEKRGVTWWSTAIRMSPATSAITTSTPGRGRV